ncbi:MAG: hypothetical protein IPP32_02880 [Bacteroidetes bacterium]|nr:hypothetical protein [Bacteroidota bacterium]
MLKKNVRNQILKYWIAKRNLPKKLKIQIIQDIGFSTAKLKTAKKTVNKQNLLSKIILAKVQNIMDNPFEDKSNLSSAAFSFTLKKPHYFSIKCDSPMVPTKVGDFQFEIAVFSLDNNLFPIHKFNSQQGDQGNSAFGQKYDCDQNRSSGSVEIIVAAQYKIIGEGGDDWMRIWRPLDDGQVITEGNTITYSFLNGHLLATVMIY